MAFVNTWEERGIQKGIQLGIEKGLEQGLEQGLEEGIERGIERGRAQGQAELLTRQLTRRFGPLQDDIHHLLASATPQQLATWADRVLDATNVDQVFGAH